MFIAIGVLFIVLGCLWIASCVAQIELGHVTEDVVREVTLPALWGVAGVCIGFAILIWG